MSSKGEEDVVETGTDVDWSPFKQFVEPLPYSQLEVASDPTPVSRVIETCFTNAPQKETPDLQSGKEIIPRPYTLPVYLSSTSPVNQLFCDSINHTCADVWYSLMNNRPMTIINKYATGWWRDFIASLQLDTKMEKDFIDLEKSNTDHSEKSSGQPDPIYSGFGRLRNGFYVSGDGHVFRSKREFEAFAQKMADLQLTLRLELEAIQTQHKKLQAKRVEERRLLSQRTESNESESDDTAMEYMELTNDGRDKMKAAERKPAIFSSMVSFAKTGIQGLFEKTSPSQKRRGAPVCTDDTSDATEDSLQQDNSGASNQVCESFDNHDEFTRQMQNEGGLTYKGTDHVVHQLSYEGLPPPLSLSSIKAEAKNKPD